MNLREIARTFYILTVNLRFFCGFSVNLRAIDRFLRDLRYIPRKICCREMPRDLKKRVGLFHVCDYHRSISTMFIILLFFNLFCLFSVEVHVCFLGLFLLFDCLLFYFLSFPQRHNSFFPFVLFLFVFF